MHADEVETDVSLVRRLLAGQFPRWEDLPIEPVPSAGTDHALYRLGDELVARLPRIDRAMEQVDKEQGTQGLWQQAHTHPVDGRPPSEVRLMEVLQQVVDLVQAVCCSM